MADIEVKMKSKAIYQPVAYIESKGDAYINTLYNPTNNTHVNIKVHLDDREYNDEGYIIGCTDVVSNRSYGVSITKRQSKSGMFTYGRLRCNFVDSLVADAIEWTINSDTYVPLNIDLTFDKNKNNVEVIADSTMPNARKISYGTISPGDTLVSVQLEEQGTFLLETPIYIFANNNNSVAETISTNIKLYAFKIYESNVLVRDFVPCYRINDKATGLYDIVNDIFYTDVNGNNFLIGENNGDIIISDETCDWILNKSWIKSVESLSQSTGQPKVIYYGVISSSGNLEVTDRNGQIKDGIINGAIDATDTSIVISANGNDVFHHLTLDSNYTKEKKLSCSLKDNLSQWDEININRIQLVDSTSSYSLLGSVLSTAGIISETSQLVDMMSAELATYMQGIIIPYPYIESGTLRNAVDTICQIAQVSVYQDDDGDIKFVSARPRVSSGEKVIQIDKSHVWSNNDADLFVKNKFSNVQVSKAESIYDYKDIGSLSVQWYELPEMRVGTVVGTDDTISFYTSIMTSYTNKVSSNTDINVIATEIKTYGEYNQSAGTMVDPRPRFILYSKTFNVDEISKYNEFRFIYDERFLSRNVGEDEVDDILGTIPTLSLKDGKVVVDNHIYLFDTYNDFLNEFFGLSGNTILYIKDDYSGGQGTGVDHNVAIVRNDNELTFYFVDLYYRMDNNSISTWISAMLSSNTTIQMKAISRESKTLSSGDNGTKKETGNNYLLQTDAIATQISDNIISDYINGIRVVDKSIACASYCYTDDTLAKDWSQGEIIKVNELVKLYNDDTIWRVVSRRFRYSGVPMLDITLRETTDVAIVYIPEGITVKKGNNTLSNGDLIAIGDTVQITAIDASLDWVKVNATSVLINTDINVTSSVMRFTAGAYNKYTITFPSRVNIYNGNTKITSGSQITEGTQLELRSLSSGEYSGIAYVQYIHLRDATTNELIYTLSVGSMFTMNRSFKMEVSFNPEQMFGDYSPYYTQFTFDGSTSTDQIYTYNPNNYNIKNKTISIMIEDGEYMGGRTISVEDTYYGSITLHGYNLYVVANKTQIAMSQQDSGLIGKKGFVEGTFILPAVTESGT